jgi:hypothetical protein
VGYKFSLVLSREVTTEAESAALLGAAMPEGSSTGVVFTTDLLPANAKITVTKINFNDRVSPSLAGAIETVNTMPGLSGPVLTAPVQPAGPQAVKPPAPMSSVMEYTRAGGIGREQSRTPYKVLGKRWPLWQPGPASVAFLQVAGISTIRDRGRRSETGLLDVPEGLGGPGSVAFG